MVWKQDLAKLKKELQESGDVNAKAVIPKVAPKPEKPADIQDEDALFLMAMGKRQASVSKAVSSVVEEKADDIVLPGKLKAVPPVQQDSRGEGAQTAVADFQEAMQSLKGIKPTAASEVIEKAKGSVTKPAKVDVAQIQATSLAATLQETKAELPLVNSAGLEAHEAVKTPLESLPLDASFAKEPTTPKRPHQINLAAGMAIDVDGTLDLRGHSRHDALERLRERIQDGVFLGWRTLHITLGPDPELKTCLMDYLAGEEAACLCRYAQAPIPMGGASAWIVYYPSH